MSLLTSGVEPLQRPYAALVALRLPEGGPLSAAGRGLEPSSTTLVVPSLLLGSHLPARASGAAVPDRLPELPRP
jgi:hypothetical protein